MLKGEGLLVSLVSETGIIKGLQLAGSIENGFIYYRFNRGNPTVLSYYYEIVRVPNPLLPKPVRLDLPRFFCLLPRHTEKSIVLFICKHDPPRLALLPAGMVYCNFNLKAKIKCMYVCIRRTKDNRRSLGRFGTFAQPLCGLKPCCSFGGLAILP